MVRQISGRARGVGSAAEGNPAFCFECCDWSVDLALGEFWVRMPSRCVRPEDDLGFEGLLRFAALRHYSVRTGAQRLIYQEER